MITCLQSNWKMLTRLARGETGRIKEVLGEDSITIQLMEMGLVPGIDIRCVGSAPLGDPLEFELLGFRLSLRRRESERIILFDD